MNRSKSAAFLMLIGSVAVGAASGYTVKGVMDKDRLCAPRQSEGDFRRRVYADLGLTEAQRAQWDSLIDARNKTVNELYAPVRVRADSVRALTREQQRAILTPEQRAKLDERAQALERQRQQERQQDKQSDPQSQADRNKSNNPRPNP